MSVIEQRGWISTCYGRTGTECGRSTFVRNQRFVVETPPGAPPCDRPHPTGVYDEPVVPNVADEVSGWCGCGEPERVDAMMLAYLASREPEGFPKPDPAGVSEDAALLLSYIADALGWTEHGGSVGGAWLTDDGRDALLAMRERAQP